MIFMILVLMLPLAIVGGTILAAIGEARRHDWRFEMSAVISNSFSVIGRAPASMLGIALLTSALPQTLLPLALTSMTGIEYLSVGALTQTWPATIGVWLVLGQFGQLAMVRISLQRLTGNRADIGDALRRAGRLLLPGIAVAILSWLAIGAGMLLLLVPGLMVLVAWIVAAVALVAEDVSILGALSRSAELTRGARWRIFLLLVLTGIAWIVASGLVGLLAGVAGATGALLGGEATGTVAVEVALATLLSSLGAAGTAAIYHELRSNKEGLAADQLEAVFA